MEGEAGTFLRTKAGRACELCRGGSRPHKAQCGEACPTSLAVMGNNTDLAIKAIPNLLVINHPPDSCEWKWKNLIPLYPSLPPLAQFWGFKLPLGIYGVRCWGLVSSPLAFHRTRSGWRGHRLARAWHTRALHRDRGARGRQVVASEVNPGP